MTLTSLSPALMLLFPLVSGLLLWALSAGPSHCFLALQCLFPSALLQAPPLFLHIPQAAPPLGTCALPLVLHVPRLIPFLTVVCHQATLSTPRPWSIHLPHPFYVWSLSCSLLLAVVLLVNWITLFNLLSLLVAKLDHVVIVFARERAGLSQLVAAVGSDHWCEQRDPGIATHHLMTTLSNSGTFILVCIATELTHTEKHN